MSDYLIALSVTLVVEVAVAAVWLIRIDNPLTRSALLVFVVGINLISHPLAWTLWSYDWCEFWMTEAGVVLLEFLALRLCLGISGKTALAISLSMNIGSVLIGVLLLR